MSKHTKGPWAWGVIDKSCAQIMSESPDVEYADMNPVLSVSICEACSSRANEDEFLWGMCLTPNKEDAKRIVSCVNACEGIESPEAIKEVIEAARDIIKIGNELEWSWSAKRFSETPEFENVKAALAKLEATG